MSKNLPVVKQIVDIGGGIPSLAAYWFLGVSGSATLTGFFVDHQGKRVGNSVSLAINAASGTADPVNLNGVTGGIPPGALGFVGDLSGDCYFDIWLDQSLGFSTDFETNYTRFPQIAGANTVWIGRVSVI